MQGNIRGVIFFIALQVQNGPGVRLFGRNTIFRVTPRMLFTRPDKKQAPGSSDTRQQHQY